jgi:hypothetical protein
MWSDYRPLNQGSAASSPYGCCCSVFFFVIEFLVLGGVGSLLHFVYVWTECHVVAAVFCAVNESVWEHMKIMLFPMLVRWIFDPMSGTVALYAAAALLLAGNAVIGALGVETLAVDITLFFVCVAFGQAMAYYVQGAWRLHPWCYMPLYVVMVALLFTCTLTPPKEPYLFEDHRNHTYGRPEVCPTSHDD